MLIVSPRHRPADLRRWAELERLDGTVARSARMAALELGALTALRDFARAGPCYASVSWGKDSVVLAHLALRLRADGLSIPLVWFPAGPLENPDSVRVRDAFLEANPGAEYREIDAVPATPDRAQLGVEGHDGAQAEFEAAAEKLGWRYASGVRAEESATRARRMKRFGLATERTCAPLGWWRTEHVFAYLFAHDLPVHPAYACLMDGQLDRSEVRVATIGGRRGVGRGRREWERRYYPEVFSTG